MVHVLAQCHDSEISCSETRPGEDQKEYLERRVQISAAVLEKHESAILQVDLILYLMLSNKVRWRVRECL